MSDLTIERVFVFVQRAALGAFSWWALTGGIGGWDWWVVGVPAVLAAAAVSVRLLPRLDWRWRGIVPYAVFFLRESLLGGMDVARRALHPRLPLNPGIVRTPLRLPSHVARVMVANTIGLVPGTLTVEVDDEELIVHGLDVGPATESSISATQRKVAGLLGVDEARDVSASSAET